MLQQTLRNNLRKTLGDAADADEIVLNVRASLDFIKTLRPEVRDVVREAYGLAVRNSFYLSLGFAACAAVSACFIREKRLG